MEIKDLITSRVTKETENQVAVQISIIASKIVRKDGNGSWPQLFTLLHDTLKHSQDERAKYYCAMTLKELIKMMKSKRLPADRKIFRTLASEIWPVAADLWLASQRGIVQSTSAEQFKYRLQAARFGLKILSSLCIHGTDNPNDCPNVKALVRNVMTELPTILDSFINCSNSSSSIPDIHLEIFGKLITKHAKILTALSEDYFVSLNDIQVELLQFAAKFVAEGRKYSQIIT